MPAPAGMLATRGTTVTPAAEEGDSERVSEDWAKAKEGEARWELKRETRAATGEERAAAGASAGGLPSTTTSAEAEDWAGETDG